MGRARCSTDALRKSRQTRATRATPRVGTSQSRSVSTSVENMTLHHCTRVTAATLEPGMRPIREKVKTTEA